MAPTEIVWDGFVMLDVAVDGIDDKASWETIDSLLSDWADEQLVSTDDWLLVEATFSSWSLPCRISDNEWVLNVPIGTGAAWFSATLLDSSFSLGW